eukprot:scaffold15878_cov57-Phaeocystis_antarctica.AAC.2
MGGGGGHRPAFRQKQLILGKHRRAVVSSVPAADTAAAASRGRAQRVPLGLECDGVRAARARHKARAMRTVLVARPRHWLASLLREAHCRSLVPSEFFRRSQHDPRVPRRASGGLRRTSRASSERELAQPAVHQLLAPRLHISPRLHGALEVHSTHFMRVPLPHTVGRHPLRHGGTMSAAGVRPARRTVPQTAAVVTPTTWYGLATSYR